MATEQGTNSPADPTYRQYTREQAATYAKHRPSPPPALVKLILDYHTSTGGCTDVLLDVGCGPGIATRALAKHFDVAVGSDAGESMIQVANELGGQTATGGQIRWVVCPAEEVGQIDGVEKQTVDLVVAAYAVSLPTISQEGKKVTKNVVLDINRHTGSICLSSGLLPPRS